MIVMLLVFRGHCSSVGDMATVSMKRPKEGDADAGRDAKKPRSRFHDEPPPAAAASVESPLSSTQIQEMMANAQRMIKQRQMSQVPRQRIQSSLWFTHVDFSLLTPVRFGCVLGLSFLCHEVLVMGQLGLGLWKVVFVDQFWFTFLSTTCSMATDPFWVLLHTWSQYLLL